jgi:GDP-L-fucose synthase
MNKVLVTGANGMLGRSVYSQFKANKIEVIGLTRDQADLTNYNDTFKILSKYQPDLIIHCAASVGGIKASIEHGAKFFLENIRIDQSVLFSARELRIKNLIYIGSSCMYPANIQHAMGEHEIAMGKLEPTNESYAIAKITGTRITQSIASEDHLNWRVFIASNLYGPFDNFDPDRAHLLASIIRKCAIAKKLGQKEIEMWGDGSPMREFTFVEDFSKWIFDTSNKLSNLPYVLNAGIGVDYSVREYYEKVLSIFGLKINIIPNLKVPNGNMKKLMDSSLAIRHGWNPKVNIDEGISKTIKWYLNNRLSA